MFEELLNPISDDAAGGEYLKDNRALFRGYRNAFNMAQSSFRQLVETPDALEDAQLVNLNSNNWHELETQCRDCLTNKSKDLEIFAWFTTAQVFGREPYQNLSSSITTLEQLFEKYWDDLQPILPEKKRRGDTEEKQQQEVVEHKLKPLLQLVGDTAESGLLYMPMQMLPLVGDVDYGQFYAAEKAGTLSGLKEQAESLFSQEQSELTARIKQLGEMIDGLKRIDQLVSTKCADIGAQGISFRFLRESAERLLNAIQYLVGEKYSHWPLDPEPEVVETPEPAAELSNDIAAEPTTEAAAAVSAPAPVQATQAQVMVPVSAVNNRKQALSDLQRIADYFETNEPHSPIYLLLKRAIRWGQMPLPELLQELVGENSAVQTRIEQLSGLESAAYESTVSASVAPQPIATPKVETNSAPTVSMPEEENTHSSPPKKDESDGGLAAMEW
ncbi:type VI secretion system ImpA family N-terminal domain-containing protein [Vibrio sp. SCSIO 43136]|uniref:type VI secretion system protein TssA n=1 Tax=Vibrio sp. SCSIO 43136 TaxID=2819101 RepID=UPI0020761D26|nr:type VI secretion system ImpA family N-terminal domain-containing protein [Vibrio sp. SCSIO 43136]USD66340.1 type VI secretion system ImpA family N-terminal domain-containing protein [Vibrio sp. SCSIO 43136]